jgi:EAL domain-containing protein (putative c-di-GMP-specific phosphodiesterase class I)
MRRAWDARSVGPYFQPIVAVDRMQVVGYEVLGRLRTPHGVLSLGPFFQDSRVPAEEKIRVDRRVVRQALALYARQASPALLFLNVNPSWTEAALDRYRDELLAEAARLGMAPDRLVIEVTENPSAGSDQALRDAVERSRAAGCRVGLDDVGSGFSQLDRVALLRPDFLKVDMRIVQRSTHAASYYHLLEGLSLIAQKLGSELLVEGIESEAELAVALAVGARYLQGFLFSPPREGWVEPDRYAPLVRRGLSALRQRRREQMRKRACLQEQLAARLRPEGESLAADGGRDPRSCDRRLIRLLEHLPPYCYRLYVCDRDGYQVSGNIERGPDGVTVDRSFAGANWTTRPYCLRNIEEAARSRDGALSDPYRDHRTRQPTLTFTYAVTADRFVFVDCRLEDLDTKVFCRTTP